MSLAGKLEDLALSDIFQILSVGRKTGTLIVQGSKGTAVIVFKNGLIVRAETDDLEKNLGQNLLDTGLIKDTIYHMAEEVKKQLPGKSLAEILFDFGSVSRDHLEKISKKRIEKVIYKLLLWEDGDFQFELDDLDLGDKSDLYDLGWEVAKGLSPEYLLMEGARVHDESTQTPMVSTEEFTMEEGGAGEGEGTGWEDDWGAPPSERKDILALRSLTQELRFPNSASEITLLVLRFASDIFQRGVLFMVGKNEMVGLGQFGLEVEGADEKVRKMQLEVGRSDFLRKLILEQMPYKGFIEKDDVTKYMMQEFGGTWPPEAAVFPIIAEGKAVALLYCDNASAGEGIGETEGLEIFINHAGLALEKSLLQRRLHDMEKGRETA